MAMQTGPPLHAMTLARSLFRAHFAISGPEPAVGLWVNGLSAEHIVSNSSPFSLSSFILSLLFPVICHMAGTLVPNAVIRMNTPATGPRQQRSRDALPPSTDGKGTSLTGKADATEEGRTQHVEGAYGIRRGVAVTTGPRNTEKRQQK